jgi:hypothetical protein
VQVLLGAVRRLPAAMPLSGRLSEGGYETHRDHWIRWLEEYDGPGFYGRSNWDVDARTVYQRLNNGRMIVWLNEAAGGRPQAIGATIREMKLRGNGRKQTEAKIARAHHPWESLAALLFSDALPRVRGSGCIQGKKEQSDSISATQPAATWKFNEVLFRR